MTALRLVTEDEPTQSGTESSSWPRCRLDLYFPRTYQPAPSQTRPKEILQCPTRSG